MEYSTKLVTNPVDHICVYTRVSTIKQSTDEKYGLSYQKELCKNYLSKFYSSTMNESRWEDIGSSYKSKFILREMGEMIRKLKPNSLILIAEVSRLGRNYKMVENVLRTVEKNKSYVVSISENLVYGMTKIMNNEFIHKVIDSEKESDVLSMRIKNIHSYIKRNGGYIGKAPFGYKIVKNSRNIPILKENPEDFKIIDYIVDLTNDCYRYDEIANIMNSKKIFFKNKSWTSIKIKDILKKFYPEHVLLNVNQHTKSKINIINDNVKYVVQHDISMNSEEINNSKLIIAAIDTLSENFFVINNDIDQHHNNKQSVIHSDRTLTNNQININMLKDIDISHFETENDIVKLRSGRIIIKA